MTKTITLLDGGSYISIGYSADHIVTIPKLGLKTKLKNEQLLLYWDSAWENKAGRPWIQLDPDDISSPTVVDVAALRTLILNWIDTESPPAELGGGSEGCYLGKPEHGDFVTTYISGTTINLGYRPGYLTGGTSAEDTPATWEAVTDASFRATIDGTAYNFDAIDFTGDTDMDEVAATIQAAVRAGTSALETVTWDTDHFIISSVLFEATSGVSVTTTSTGVVGTDISGIVGTWMDADAGNGVVTAVRGGYPPGVTGFTDEDIEYVRQIATDGSVTGVYERVDSIMSITGHTLTVAEATFLSTDTFVVGTNIPRGSVDDIIRFGGGSYIGKATNGDFVTAYTSATTITLSSLPVEIINVTGNDIEVVKQLDAADNVIKTFTKDDTLMSVAANVLTVTDAAFAATDTFVVYTNIPRTAEVVDLSSDIAPSYIGKNSGTNADFTVAYTAATQITLSDFTPDITQIYESDIEVIRQCTAGGVLVAKWTHANSTINDNGSSVITVTEAAFGATDLFVVFTNIPKPSGGGGGIEADFKIGSWDGTVTYASTTTLTLAGAYPTINYDSQIIYIKYTDATLDEAEIFRNGQGGVLIEHSAGTLTLVNAGTPFAATNVYEVGISATPLSLDIASDTTKTTEQAPDYGHYTDAESLVSEADLGIAETGDGDGDTNTLEDDTGAFDAENVAVGYTAWQTTDTESATVNSITDADTIETGTLTGAATWAAKAYLLPECKRFIIYADSYNHISVQVQMTANDANNACYCKIYASNVDAADDTDDTDWVDVSEELFGIAQLEADGITAGAAASHHSIHVVDVPTVILKYCIKIVGECKDATPDNNFDIYIKKGY